MYIRSNASILDTIGISQFLRAKILTKQNIIRNFSQQKSTHSNKNSVRHNSTDESFY